MELIDVVEEIHETNKRNSQVKEKSRDSLRIYASNNTREEESNDTLKMQSFKSVIQKKANILCHFMSFYFCCVFLLASSFESESTGMQAI